MVCFFVKLSEVITMQHNWIFHDNWIHLGSRPPSRASLNIWGVPSIVTNSESIKFIAALFVRATKLGGGVGNLTITLKTSYFS